jgi:hypothetical protein
VWSKIPDPMICSRCKSDGVNTLSQSFVDFTVTCAQGEEGYASIRQWICDDCLPAMQDALIALGFKDHHHGGINFLEDENCPVMAEHRAEWQRTKIHVWPPPCDSSDIDGPYDAGQLGEVST